MVLIFLEGCDRSGKSSVIKKLSSMIPCLIFKSRKIKDIEKSDMTEITKGELYALIELDKLNLNKIILCDRSIWTEYSYSKTYGRNCDVEALKEICSELQEQILVYLYCDEEEHKKRYGDEALVNYDKIQHLNEYFEESLEILKMKNFYHFKTSQISTEAICNDLLKIISTDYLVKSYVELILDIEKTGNKINNTLEKRNIELTFANIEYSKILNLIDEKLSLFEEEEYLQLYTTLSNTIRVKTLYLKNQDKNSRQFVYHSDGCISFYQALFRDNNLFVYAVLRSSDIKKMLLLDCLNIYEIGNKLNKKYFNTKNIIVNIKIVSGHVFI